MFGRKKKNQLDHRIDTLIGTNTRITGDIHFTGGLRIDGHITGNIFAIDDEHSTLVLSNEGSIKGKIKATNVVINGTVSGPIDAQGYLELQEKAKVYGDVHYGSIEIQLGASVDGKMIHQYKQDSAGAQQSDKMITLAPATDQQHTAAENDSL
ncbi:bactofilin family protein [Nitrosomonas supralitoralis]|uniref:Polymer-forming cytoskeletal protein n=1 Tax=Nitrosomonas supralitoralis TaxID=2116706 RepID=A0A2P7NXP0_9PROT|nr:polymer-forming cytoskeletal protein [Nitrosomonas supralitoralis]PSJ18232.1 polymer-forming cytoskeletal protein [Nitrosomonas supralitoralis]